VDFHGKWGLPSLPPCRLRRGGDLPGRLRRFFMWLPGWFRVVGFFLRHGLGGNIYQQDGKSMEKWEKGMGET